MGMDVAVPVSLLEDIFSLLYYLDRLEGYGCLDSRKPGHSHRFEHDAALWELRLKIKRLQSHAVETYLLTVSDVTEDERRDLMEWAAAGYSVYDNPYLIYNDSGCPMDFINGCRMGIEFDDEAEGRPHFFWAEPKDADNCGWDSGLPF